METGVSNSKTVGSYDLGSLLHKFLQGKALMSWSKIPAVFKWRSSFKISARNHPKINWRVAKNVSKSLRITSLIFNKPKIHDSTGISIFWASQIKHPPRVTCRSFHSFVEHGVDGWNVLHDTADTVAVRTAETAKNICKILLNFGTLTNTSLKQKMRTIPIFKKTSSWMQQLPACRPCVWWP